MTDPQSYEVAVVGGGPAGMTTALYTTRLGHSTVVFEKAGGRHAAVSHVHNLLGVSEDVSGQQLANHAVEQLEEYGGDYFLDSVDAVRRVGDTDEIDEDESGIDAAGIDDVDDGVDTIDAAETDAPFRVEGTHSTIEAERVVFATGFTDTEPDVQGLRRFTGRGLHYCPHCDAYTLGDGRAFVLGHDDHAATVAMLLLNFTADVELLLDDREPEWSDETERKLRAHPIDRIDEAVVDAFPDDESSEEPWLGGLTFADGTEREYLGGFAVYGKEYNTDLAEELGCEIADDGAIAVDEDFETSVAGAYAVGDATHGQNQTVVAMGDGAKAGMALHEDLRRYPRRLEELDDVDESAVPGAPDDLRARMRLVRERTTHSGLREPQLDR